MDSITLTKASSQDDLAAYAADAASAVDGENILASITRLARELRQAQEDVKAQEEALKAAQARVQVLEEVTLPSAMDEAGQKKLTTVDGYELERDEVIRASISAANMPAAVMWLRNANHASVVKRELKLAFGKDEDQKAAEAYDALREHGFTPDDKQSVHPQTLAALVRELLGEGVEVPMQLLGVYVQPRVKMKLAKKK